MDLWDQDSLHLPRLAPAAEPAVLDIHLAALEYTLTNPITIRDRSDILSQRHWSEHLEPFEHQVRNLVTYCRRAPVALIADDVGLGKTISAGLILSELMTRKKVQRALVLCPKLLLPQWCEELQSKFKIDAQHAVGQALPVLCRTNVPVVVTTYESARGRFQELSRAFFNMLILDEAHKLRNLYGTASPPKLATAVRKALADNVFQYSLLLTATPIQNRLWDIYSLVDCLSAGRRHANPLGSPNEFAARYLADGATAARELNPGRVEEFRRRIGEYMVRTSRRDSNLVFPTRTVKTFGCQRTEVEHALEALVRRAMSGMNALARSSVAEALFSSPKALATQLANMARNGTVAQGTASEAARVAAASPAGCKFPLLVRVMETLRRERGSAWRMVVFTRRKETQDQIGEGLARHGALVGHIRGGQAIANTRAIRGFWKQPPEVNALVSTDAGAEGVNLQIANVVVNYDLPWNPMVVEQRIGRVQRLKSDHKNIIVANLVVQDSVEEIVVARLIAKLQAISTTIGDIEGILEAAGQDRDGDLEDKIRDLVVRALMGQDVRQATERIQRSIDAAKRLYEEEKETVERTLGSLDAMHSAGPKLPDLRPTRPRLTIEEFVRASFVAEGSRVEPLRDARFSVSPPGRPRVIVTFNERDPDLVDDGLMGFGGRRVELFAEGRPAFERQVGAWAKRHCHLVRDGRDGDGASSSRIAEAWTTGLGPEVAFLGFVRTSATDTFQGSLILRASASVAHDRYEKLVEVPLGGGGSSGGEDSGAPVLAEELDATGLLDGRAAEVRQVIEADRDVAAFCSFYLARRREEVGKAAGDPQRSQAISRNFSPALSADLVAARGVLRERVTGTVRYAFGDSPPYQSTLVLDPDAGAVLEEPERKRCALTGMAYPVSCLEPCAITGNPVLAHMLVRSERSLRGALPDYSRTCEVTRRRLLVDEGERCSVTGKWADRELLATCEISGRRALATELVTSERSERKALPEFRRPCAVSGRVLLADEVGTSDVGGQTVDLDLLKDCAVSGKRALESELVRCAFTGVLVAPECAFASEVSGRHYRGDEGERSAVSGVAGHRTEFARCEETEAWLLPSELGRSSLSDLRVRADLLMASEKSPQRHGLAREFVQCQVSGKRLLRDELETSTVSGVVADSDLMARSDVSGRYALLGEIVTCEETGTTCLPDETGVCDSTGKRVRSDLLIESSVSGRQVLSRLLRVCPETQQRALEEEMVQCEVSGLRVVPGATERCTVTGKRVVRRLTVPCASCHAPLLRSEAARSDTGQLGHREHLHPCTWSGRQLFEGELVTCPHTGVWLEPRWLGAAKVSEPHERLLRQHGRLDGEDQGTLAILGDVLAPFKVKPTRAWMEEAASGNAAALVEWRDFLGFRRRHGICFFNPETRTVLGHVSQWHQEGTRWTPGKRL